MNKELDKKNGKMVERLRKIMGFLIIVCSLIKIIVCSLIKGIFAWLSRWLKPFTMIGNDLLNFLRNLTPIILVSSISILALRKLDFGTFDSSNWVITLFAFSSSAVAIIAMILNIIQFFNNSIESMKELKQYKKDQNGGNYIIIIFISYAVYISLIVVIISSLAMAYNTNIFLRT